MALSPDLVEKLMTVRAERIVSPFFVDPGVEVRHLTAEESVSRESHCAEMTYEIMLVIDGDPLKSIYDLCVDNMDMIIKDGEEVLRYRDKK